MDTSLTAVEESAIAKNDITMDIAARWTKFLDVKPQSAYTYKRIVKQFMLYLMNNNITQPERDDIIRYRSTLINEGKKPTTIQSYLAGVRMFFQWLAAENLYPNISEHVKSVSVDNTFKKDYLTSRQARKLLESIPCDTIVGLRDYAMYALMLTAGLRTIEVSRACMKDMRPLGDFMVLYVQGKGRDGKDEYVKIVPEVEDAIEAYLQVRTKMVGAPKPDDALFINLDYRHNHIGENISTRSISRNLKARLISIGLNSDRLTAHSLRHTTATLNIRNGGSIAETQQLLRHKKIDTTMIYSHMLEREFNNSEARVAKTIFGE